MAEEVQSAHRLRLGELNTKQLARDGWWLTLFQLYLGQCLGGLG
jgi:hypothetical protein